MSDVDERVPGDLRWSWNLLAIVGFVTVWTSAVGRLPGAIRWSIEHDLRWFGWLLFVAGLGSAIIGCGVTLVLLWRFVGAPLVGRDDP